MPEQFEVVDTVVLNDLCFVVLGVPDDSEKLGIRLRLERVPLRPEAEIDPFPPEEPKHRQVDASRDVVGIEPKYIDSTMFGNFFYRFLAIANPLAPLGVRIIVEKESFSNPPVYNPNRVLIISGQKYSIGLVKHFGQDSSGTIEVRLTGCMALESNPPPETPPPGSYQSSG